MTGNAFLFGKLPAHGDFVVRGLAAAEREAIDRWLSAALADAATTAGWGSAYDRAPPWRFVRSVASGWQAGAIACSADRVGRRFPLLAGLGGLDAGEVGAVPATVERLLAAALAGGWDADRLADAVSTLAVARSTGWTGGDRWWTVAAATGGLTGAEPRQLVRAMLASGGAEAEGGGMTGGLRFDCGALSHEGRVRTNNEDALLVRPADGVYLVADGMGGHENGEWASAAIVAGVGAVALPAGFNDAVTLLADALHAANARIFAEASRRGIRMGSTAVLLFVRDDRFAVLWVGDSRAYIVRGGVLVQLSRDHSQVQEMLDRGLLTAADAEHHPMSHVLARAVGVQAAVEVDAVSDMIEPGDVFLLCSDGLTARVEDAEIAAMLTVPGAEDRVRRLVGLTLERGAPDNVTVISVGAEPAPAASPYLQTVAR